MPELGGPTTQSGILYQNSIAALYLGQLIDVRKSPSQQRVSAVRVEAPEFVDDIVVTFGSGTRLLVQAKERLVGGSEPWRAFWLNTQKQIAAMGSNSDRILLTVGNYNEVLDDLRELCDRTKGKDTSAEWLNSLSVRQTKVVEHVARELNLDASEIYPVFSRVEVQFQTWEQLETIGVRDHVPESSVGTKTLFAVLRDLCGVADRERDTFTARSLAETLYTKHKIKLLGAPADGVVTYLSAVESKHSMISVPGTSLRGSSEALWGAPSIVAAQPTQGHDFDEEAYYGGRLWFLAAGQDPSSSLDLADYPKNSFHRVLIEAGAGFGKSSVLAEIARQNARQGVYIPVILSAQVIGGQTAILDVITQQVESEFRVSLDWPTLLYQGRAMVLIDGVDELSDEGRSLTIDRIRQLVAIFPDAPIVVATRDGASIPLVPLFSCFRINRLGREEQVKFLKRYLSARPEIKAQRVISDLLRSEELSALCSIPLFMALLVSTMPKSGKLPRGRSELLERYLAVALAPQQHRPVSRPRLALSPLRKGAEAVALAALKRNEIAIPETYARELLNEHLGYGSGDHCVDDLIQCGVLLRKGFRIGFAIATVQEYLAGCAIARLPADQFSSWFTNVARRPWAQAIQFAIEKAEAVEPVLISQVDSANDDVFHTTLLIISRSIANGLKVSPDFRLKIVDRLIDIWPSRWDVRRKVDAILLDGLAIPPTPRLLHLLCGSEKTDGHPELVLQIGDKDIALKAIVGLLENRDIRSLWSDSWQDVIRFVIGPAMPLILEKAKHCDTLSEGVIASLIFSLRDLPGVDWAGISGDSSLPKSVKVASLWGAQLQNTAVGRRACEELIGSGRVEGWLNFSEAYCLTDWWPNHLEELVYGDANSFEERTNVFNELASGLSADGASGKAFIQHLSTIIKNNTPHKDTLFSAVLLSASFADSHSIDYVLKFVDKIELDNISELAAYLPYFAEDARCFIVQQVIRRASNTPIESDILMEMMHGGGYVASGRRVLAPMGPYYVIRSKPPSVRLLAGWVNDYLGRVEVSRAERAELISRLVQFGLGDEPHLAAMVESFAKSVGRMDRENWGWVATAVRALLEAGYQLPTEVLWRLAEISEGFPTDMFFEALIDWQKSLCSPGLEDLYRRSPANRGSILSALSSLAPFYGVVVKVEGERLTALWPD